MGEIKCQRCQHYSYCTEPCPGAQKYLKQKGAPLESVRIDRENGKIWTVYTPHRRELNFTTLEKENKEGETQDVLDYISSEQIESSLKEIYSDKFKNKTTQIFLDRFFLGYSFEYIRDKYGLSDHGARSLYDYAKSRIYEMIRALEDGGKETFAKNMAKASLDKTYKLSNKQKCFLLHQCFGLSYADIAEIVNMPHDTVKTYVYRARKDVDAGRFKLEFEEVCT